MKGKCTDCKWYFQDDEATGECRRYPPTIQSLQAQMLGWMEDDMNTGVFPKVWGHSWCGEWVCYKDKPTAKGTPEWLSEALNEGDGSYNP